MGCASSCGSTLNTYPALWSQLTGGTLTSAQYTASYSYDTLGRLTSAPLGSYTYGDPNHLDAATSVGSTYTASYDAAGDMTCRAPTNTVTCSGTPTGAALTYDAERRLATWQNTPCAILRATESVGRSP